jgi:3-oxoacyl-[acyl-carrier-protein] synthase-3
MLFIHGMGHFHPENIIDNAFLTALGIGTDEAWILERVGIRERRTVLPLEYIQNTKNASPAEAAKASLFTNAHTGAVAARMALKRSGLMPKDVGLVIAGGCAPQYSIPAEACTIAAELGINAPAYDVSSACSSFAVQMHHLMNMRPETLPRYVLVVNVENMTRTVNYSDRNTAVLWGDASSAAVVSAAVPAAMQIAFSTVESDPSGWKKVFIPTGGHFEQDGHAVQTFAIRKSVQTGKLLRQQIHNHPRHLYFIGHQANLLMLQAVSERLEIPAWHHLYNVDRFGNCGAAGAPGVLSQHWDRFNAGDEIMLVVVGAGLTWGGMLLRVGRSA